MLTNIYLSKFDVKNFRISPWKNGELPIPMTTYSLMKMKPLRMRTSWCQMQIVNFLLQIQTGKVPAKNHRSNQNKSEYFVIRVTSYFGGLFRHFASQRRSTNLVFLKKFLEIFKKSQEITWLSNKHSMAKKSIIGTSNFQTLCCFE